MVILRWWYLFAALAVSGASRATDKLAYVVDKLQGPPASLRRQMEDHPVPDVLQICTYIAMDMEDMACTCILLDVDEAQLNCASTDCQLCNDDFSSCFQESFNVTLIETEDGMLEIPELFNLLQYDPVGTRDEELGFHRYGCTGGVCDHCDAYVNNERCNSCEVCDTDWGDFIVDCENLVRGSSFVGCSFPPIEGVFEAFDYENYVCDAGHETPENDLCTNATVALPGDYYYGTLLGARNDFGVIPECVEYGWGSYGVWYKVEGTGRLLFATTCSTETYVHTTISVYEGSCGSLHCVRGFSQTDFCSDYSRGSGSWPTVEGTTYYILVGSAYSDQSEFKLSLFEGSEGNNTACSTTDFLEVDGPSVLGALQPNADGSSLNACGNHYDPYAGEAWYQLESASEATIRISTCSAHTNFYSGISLFNGICSDLNCTDYAEAYAWNFNCSGGGNRLEFQAIPGIQYYALVWGSIEERGVFEINVHSLQPPTNDYCKDAIGLPVGGAPIQGSLVDATVSDEEQYPDCSSGYGYDAGVWYVVQGNWTGLKAAMCSRDFHSMMSVYSGSCDGLQCVAVSTEDYSTCHYIGAAVSWQAEAGAMYYILARSSGGEGTFNLTVDSFSPPENDNCTEAIPILANSTTIIGTTEHAISDGIYGCNNEQSPGLWYSLLGTGDTFRADTCAGSTNFDTEISVFEGSCHSRTCVGNNDDACNGLSSSFSWISTPGVMYYVRVHGHAFYQTGVFGLTVHAESPPSNDDCETAIGLSVSEFYVGSTSTATPEDGELCGLYHSGSSGVWFYVNGTDQVIQASTCNDITTASTVISVVRASSCSDQYCEVVATHDYSCWQWNGHSVRWFADASERYFILVSSQSYYMGGTFGLNITAPDTIENDACENAQPVHVNETITGTTVDAFAHDFHNVSCPTFSSPGVWYSFRGGNGNSFMASTCSEVLNFYTYVSVYAGSCEQLECVDYVSTKDPNCPWWSDFSAAIWTPEEGVEYYIYVQGTSTHEVGSFGMTVSRVTLPENNFCHQATPMQPNGQKVVGSTVHATDSGVTDCYSSGTSPDVWYTVNGTGALFTASLCHDETNYDTFLSIFVGFEGACERMICIDANDDSFCGGSSVVEWETAVGETYFVRVHGYSNRKGNFGLSVSGASHLVNDECIGAVELDPYSDEFVAGSTTDATFTSVDYCGATSYSTSPDLWYWVRGTGEYLTVSTCSEGTDFDTQINVYEVYDNWDACNHLLCIDGNDDGCSYARSYLEFYSRFGAVYYIRVSGYSSTSGNFEVKVTSLGGTADDNDSCLSAVELVPGMTVEGSTLNASPDPLMTSCGGATAAVSNGVWYHIVGDGGLLTASTCVGADFDTQISIFTGECGYDGAQMGLMECVTGNDQWCGHQSQVEWHTIPGMRYYLLVHGWLTSKGNFLLSLDYSVYEEDDDGGWETGDDDADGGIDFDDENDDDIDHEENWEEAAKAAWDLP